MFWTAYVLLGLCMSGRVAEVYAHSTHCRKENIENITVYCRCVYARLEHPFLFPPIV